MKPRYEFKYVAPHATAASLLELLADVVVPDPHGGEDGYLVSSLYYDTSDFAAYFEKLDGVDPRYKVRLRVYGEGEDFTGRSGFLEIKHRRDNLIHKDRVELSGRELPDLIDHSPLTTTLRDRVGPDQVRTAGIVECHAMARPVAPACIVSYRRRAWVTRIDPTLRVTVDTNLRALGPRGDLARAGAGGDPFLPRTLCVIELKFHWAMPLWLVAICRELGMRLRRYSKYAAAIEHVLPHLAHRQVRVQG